MITCKDCIHRKVCKTLIDATPENEISFVLEFDSEKSCTEYKSESNCFIIPCQPDDTAYHLPDGNFVCVRIESFKIDKYGFWAITNDGKEIPASYFGERFFVL